MLSLARVAMIYIATRRKNSHRHAGFVHSRLYVLTVLAALLLAQCCVSICDAAPAALPGDTTSPALTPGVSSPREATHADRTRGEYLATAGNCRSCHTPLGAAPFSGGVPFETPFGTLYSSNITPDLNSGIGKWNLNDLTRAMHEGVAPEGSRLFPAFPYPHFTKVADADIEAIYTYLKSLNAVEYSPPANTLLFKQRWGMKSGTECFLMKAATPQIARNRTSGTAVLIWSKDLAIVVRVTRLGIISWPKINRPRIQAVPFWRR